MSRIFHRQACIVALVPCIAALAACKPQIPDRDERPEPQTAAASQAPTALRESIQRPIDKAKAAEEATAAAEKNRDEALDAATGE